MNASLKKFKRKKIDFLIAHPPYLDIIKFTNQREDLSNESNINIFIEKLMIAFDNALTYLEKGKYFGIVMGDVYKDSQVIPLGFYTMNAKNLLGNPYSFYKGDEDYNENIGCEGCYQYDPVEYRKSSAKKIALEAVQHTVDFVMKKLYGDE